MSNEKGEEFLINQMYDESNEEKTLKYDEHVTFELNNLSLLFIY
jgi:hypothetical protein